MNDEDYMRISALFLAGGKMHTDKVTTGEVDFMMHAAQVATSWCDTVKRGLFYGSDIQSRTSFANSSSLTLDPALADLIHGVIGLFGEAGELLEHLHDVLTGRATLDPVNILEEMGDLEWYAACVHRFIGTTTTKARDVNIAKLDKRYPGRVWSQDAAVNRDTAAERQVLEEGVLSSAHGRVLMQPVSEDAPPPAVEPVCSVCGEPQFETPHGVTCRNGHGGAPEA